MQENVSSRTSPRRLGALAIAIALLIGCLSWSTARADATSAFPFKSAGDSGQIYNGPTIPSSGCGNGGLCVEGWDACTYSSLIGGGSLNLQQYTVPGCTPVQTPWIQVKWWTTSSWTVYCPSSAPYAWNDNGWPGSQGQTFQWWSDSNSIGSLSVVPFQNKAGPSPPGQMDYSVHNWGTSDHNWLYIAACSTMSNDDPAAEHQPPYSHGIGPSAVPHGLPRSITGTQSSALSMRQAVRGPSYRLTAVSSRAYKVTREANVKPRTRAIYRLACRPGYRITSRRSAIGRYTINPPTARDGTVRTRMRTTGRSVAVTVQPSRRVRAGTARLQIAVGCGRVGHS
jgi:hypothetical protein